MIVPLSKSDIAALLRAIRDKQLDTDQIAGLKGVETITINIQEATKKV